MTRHRWFVPIAATLGALAGAAALLGALRLVAGDMVTDAFEPSFDGLARVPKTRRGRIGKWFRRQRARVFRRR